MSLEQAVRGLLRELELGAAASSLGSVAAGGRRPLRCPAGHPVSGLSGGLNNVVKHANASSVTIRAHRQGERLTLLLEDDGCGLPEHRTPRAMACSAFANGCRHWEAHCSSPACTAPS